MKEYIVTLHSYEDLDSFYDDMETVGGNLYIPGRKVDIVLRRPGSRNTHYMLTESEVEQLRADPRVSSIESTLEDRGIVARPLFVQTETTWDKSISNNAAHRNWGLLRCVEGIQRSNWGSNSVPNRTQLGTIQVNAEGRNVDIVIVDGMINPNHPEYAVNSDGTGGSRVIQYNWFQHDLGSGTGTYVYTPYVDGTSVDRTADNNHGAHVAGIAAGNRQGWARSANIYNINPYSTDVNGLNSLLLIDYIRAWHNSKPINPVTGRRNPTICNHSWGFLYQRAISSITNISYRGSFLNGAPYSAATLNNYGIYNDGTNTLTPARSSAFEADLADAIADGIIMVASAGNEYSKIDVSDGVDYNNFYVSSVYAFYWHEGGTPGSANLVINVGAIGSLSDDSKGSYSNTGPRVDIFAPGSSIISSFNSTDSFGGVADSRNSSYYQGKISGTSMASPQVTGVLACALEIYPRLTASSAAEYIRNTAKTAQITATSGGYSDYTDLQGAANRYLYMVQERPNSGSTWPKSNYFLRPVSGRTWPRTVIRRT